MDFMYINVKEGIVLSKVNLLIADADEQYVEGLVAFLSENYYKLFQITSFTNSEHLSKYLVFEGHKIDVILINENILIDKDLIDKIKIKVNFTNNKIKEDKQGNYCIHKFQSCDKIAMSLLDIFTEGSEKQVVGDKGYKRTKVISIFSPIGGSGKTSFAVALSKKLTSLSYTCFYLNFEYIPITDKYFSSTKNGYSMSNILYNLKEKNKNMPLKIELSKNIDQSGVHYFSPLESLQELDEMTDEEINMLFSSFKEMSIYDFLIVDMSALLSRLNINILQNSDEVYLLTTNSNICQDKLIKLQSEFEIIKQRTGNDIFGKSTTVLNMINSHDATGDNTISHTHRLPYIYDKNCVSLVDIMAEKLEIDALLQQ